MTMYYGDDKNDLARRYDQYDNSRYQGPPAAGPSQYGAPSGARGDAPPAYEAQQGYPPPSRSYAEPPRSYPQPTGSYAPPQSSYAPPARAAPPSAVAEDGSPQGSVYAQAKAAYDNPLAHNDEWAPTSADFALRALPKIDFMLKVKSRLSRSAGKPFDTEPRSFRRPAPRAQNPPFAPLILQPEGKDGLIGAGFKPNYFGPVLAAHDVSAADYARFLEDIFTAGKVGGAGQLAANVAPITMHMGVTGYFVTKAIVRGMARRNEPIVVDTIETWQERFFGPRGLDVYVAYKGERATARHVGVTPDPLAPELVRMTGGSREERERRERRSSSSDSSSDSDADRRRNPGDYANLSKKDAEKLAKRRKKERKEERKDRKEARKEEKKREKKDKKDKKAHGPFLVIEPLPFGAATAPYGGYGRV